jgi:phosphate:Na+ symporter
MAAEQRLDRFRKLLRGQRHLFRERTIAMASTGRIEGEATMRLLDAVRWLHRVNYHIWRIQHHLNLMRGAAPPTLAPSEAEEEVLQEYQGSVT